MKKPDDFDTAKAYGGYTPLPSGGYVCKIIGVDEVKSQKGKDMLKIALDIAEGEEAGRFMREFKLDTRDYKKWPNSGIVHQLVLDDKGNTNGGFKQFTNCVVDSNNGFQIVWGDGFCKCFKDKLIGVLFGREQYVNRDGELKWSTKPKFFKTVEQIRKGVFKVPEDKLVESGANKETPLPSGFGQLQDDDIPF